MQQDTFSVQNASILQLQPRDYIDCNWENRPIAAGRNLLQLDADLLQLRPIRLQLDTNHRSGCNWTRTVATQTDQSSCN
jgi:hypothetical protein